MQSPKGARPPVELDAEGSVHEAEDTAVPIVRHEADSRGVRVELEGDTGVAEKSDVESPDTSMHDSNERG